MVGQVDDLIVLLLAMIKVVEELLLVTWAEAEVRIPLLKVLWFYEIFTIYTFSFISWNFFKDLDQHEVHPVTPLAAIMVAEDNGPLEIIGHLVDNLPLTPHPCMTNKNNGTKQHYFLFRIFQISSYNIAAVLIVIN